LYSGDKKKNAGKPLGFDRFSESLDADDLATMGETHVMIEIGAGPDVSEFQTAVDFINGLALRGKSVLEVEGGDIIFQGEFVVLDDQKIVCLFIFNDEPCGIDLCVHGIVGDDLAFQTHGIKEFFGGRDLIGFGIDLLLRQCDGCLMGDGGKQMDF
jgi:hypothetical protein